MSEETIELFADLYGAKPEPVRCRFHGRREHAGGTPDSAYENGGATESQPFPWQQVYHDLDGEQDRAELDTVAAAGAMADMLDWIQEPWQSGTGSEVNTDTMQRCKLTVLRLILRPTSLGNPVPNLGQLANRCGVTKQTLSKLACDFRDRFGVVSPWMASKAARQAYAEGKGDRRRISDNTNPKDR